MERIRLDLSKTGSSVASYGETAEKFNEKMEDLKLDVDIAELKTQLKNVEARLAEILVAFMPY